MKLPVDERKKYVIQLHKKGRTDRQIAEELRMSSRDVVNVLKENEREEQKVRESDAREKEEKEKEKLFSSKRSKALQLYKKGTNPLDVAIELDISAEDAKAFYHEYCSLKYPPEVLQIYKELNTTNSFKDFTDLFYSIKEKGLSNEEAFGGIRMINDISLLKAEYQDLSDNVSNLKELQDSLKADNNFLRVQNEEMDLILNSTLEKIDIKEKILEITSNKVKQQEQLFYKINSVEDYDKMRDKIKLTVEEILGSRKNLIVLAVSSVFDAVKEIQQKEIPIKDLPKSVYEYVSNSSNDEIYQQKLQDAAEKLWDSITDVCTDDVLNPSSNILKI